MKVAYMTHPHNGILTELLLAHKAKPDTQTPDGTTALIIATLNDHAELVEIMVHHGGSNVNLGKKDGNTALHLCAEQAKFGMVAHLVSLGADPALKNAGGVTVHDMKC